MTNYGAARWEATRTAPSRPYGQDVKARAVPANCGSEGTIHLQGEGNPALSSNASTELV
jgi:hypothetical protein